MWPGRTRFTDGHDMGSLPWPDRVQAVAGSITGTIWWDRNENTTIDPDEDTIPNIKVSLWQVDDKGQHVGNDPMTTVTTGSNGQYTFDMLHSGTYRTEVKRNPGETTDDGVQTKTTTYYNQQQDVTNTYSWNWQLRKHARDDSDTISLLTGQNQTNVNFGYAKPDPKATVDKTQTRLDCTDTSCEVNWDVKVANSGKTTGKLPNGVTIETFSAANDHSLAVGSDGSVYAWGFNDSGQLGDGTIEERHTPVKVKTPDGVTFTQVSVSAGYSLAVGSDGSVYAWGFNDNGQLGDGTIEERHTPVKVKTPDGVTLTQVTAGNGHSLAVASDGSIYAWGFNDNGQLGDGTIEERLTPVKVKTPDGVTFTQVSAGDSHSLAVGSDGSIYAWGTNNAGQLGDGTTGSRLTPVKVKMPDGVTFTQVSAGDSHSLAVGSDGSVYAWGFNGSSQLGDGTTGGSRFTPVKVKMPDGVTFTQVNAGRSHSLAVGSDGSVYAWGFNGSGQLGDGTTEDRHTPVKVKTPDGVTFTQVNAGGYHSLAVGSDGNTYALGWNIFGQLGDGTTEERHTPVKVLMPQGVTVKSGVHAPDDQSDNTAGTSSLPTSSTLTDRMSNAVKNVSVTAGTTSRTPDQTVRFKQVSAGHYHSLAVSSDGSVYAWGYNANGELGDSTTDSRFTPVKVKTPDDVTFTQVSAGTTHSLAVGSDGNIYAWGYNANGELGDSTTDNRFTPVKVKTPDDVTFTQVSAGAAYSLAVASDGSVYAWGFNNHGMLGDGTIEDRHTPVKVKTPDGVTFTQVSAGIIFSLAVASDGNTYAWGFNNHGMLGDGTTEERHTPVKVKTPDGVTFTQVSAGINFSLAVASDGNTYAWGSNSYGRLGDGTTENRLTPVKVKTPDGVTFTQVVVGYYHSLAVGSDGSIYAWGDNTFGELGNGNSGINSNVPAKVKASDGDTFTQVSAGYYHSLAVGSDGNIYAWGSNNNGQLGDGTIEDRHTPVKVKTPVVPGVSTDPTAVPVEPVTTNSDDTDTTRTYNLPYTVAPGGSVVYHFNGTVDRAKVNQIIHNQAWFDSPDTPYAVETNGKVTAGVPHALGRTSSTPDKPDDAKLDTNSHDITGNPSCMTGSDYSKPDMEHWFSTSAEDQCDQVGTVIPAYAQTPVLGSISGLYWRDTNGDGIRQNTETDRIQGRQVVLEDTDGNQVATTTTDDKGEYKFDKLKPGTYRIRFSRVERADFTTPDKNDPTPDTDGSSMDSDAGTGDDYGMGTPTITLTDTTPDKTHVDAGVKPDKPYTNVMPYTGVIVLPLVLLLSIGFLIGAVILLRQPKTKTTSDQTVTTGTIPPTGLTDSDTATTTAVATVPDPAAVPVNTEASGRVSEGGTGQTGV